MKARGMLAAKVDWRGDWDTPSVPVLNGLLADPDLPLYLWELTRNTRDTAQWLLAVRSHRWVTESATADYVVEANWWYVWRGVLAHRWALSQRCGPLEGFLSSTELAVRPRFPAAMGSHPALLAMALLAIATELENRRLG